MANICSVILLFLLCPVSCVLRGWADSLIGAAKISTADIEKIALGAESSAHNMFLARVHEQTLEREKANGTVGQAKGGICPECERLYLGCPLGWSGTDGLCLAPASYNGICNKVQSFVGGSEVDKMEAEEVCGICWPCVDEGNRSPGANCERDFDAYPCPLGFSPQSIAYDSYGDVPGISCAADPDYRGICAQQTVSFNNVQEKLEFAQHCGTTWPCVIECGPDGSAGLCPENWVHLGDGICTAPQTYKLEGCPLMLNMRGWTQSLKLAFTKKCSVHWVCDNLEKTDVCEDLDTDRCPRRWKLEPGFVCVPPPDVVSRCSKSMMFQTMSIDDRILWASDCGVEWPCRGEVPDGSHNQFLVATDLVGPIGPNGVIVPS